MTSHVHANSNVQDVYSIGPVGQPVGGHQNHKSMSCVSILSCLSAKRSAMLSNCASAVA